MGDENKVSIDLDLAIRKAIQDIEQINRKLDDFADKAEKTGKRTDGAFDQFKGTLAGIEASKAFHAILEGAEKLFDVFVTEGIQAASAQEDAINAMNTALISSGQYSERASEGLIKFAEGIQKTTKYSDDEVLKNAALIESITHLSDDGLKKATQASIDLASAMHIDLASAAERVGKAAEGNTVGLQKMGIYVKKGRDDAETFGNALAALSVHQGTAERQSKTFSGAMAILGNTFEDVQENTGALITQNPAIIAGINVLSKTFGEWSKVVSDNKEQIQALIVNGLFQFMDALVATLRVLQVGWNFFKVAFDGIRVVVDVAALLIIQNFANITKGLDILTNHIPGLHGTFSATAGALKDMSAAMATEVGKDFKTMKDDAGNVFGDGLLSKAADEVDKFEGRFKLAVANISKTDSDRTKIAQANAQARIAVDEQEKAKMRQHELEFTLAIKRFDELTSKEKVARLSETFGTIAGLTKSNNIALFRIGQAGAEAQAIIEGALAVQKALAAAPPPFNFILAGLVGTATAANILTIAQQQPPAFEAGGIMGGTSYTGDNLIARVNSREGVITLEQQTDLFNFIKSGAQGGGRGGVTVNVHGNVIADDDYQVQKLGARLREQIEFGNISLAPVV